MDLYLILIGLDKEGLTIKHVGLADPSRLQIKGLLSISQNQRCKSDKVHIF